ncbi:hypothetical protein SS1G_13051 [Sclerotinia sclerotiorum 1980 UF-70]|uniref:Glucose-methanol-choline oxidoreductase N-terminal domain-containing protein n=1 Tax=Sclerotinia sclerotiorum (strain ATCC 18683 / 1980 / Ss-1) TaxID=665079 RepID=A7F623_SCLS1|nr:hypothetical protein SS1G_13051 [Sclerotinia sclerotiorum 1980 UF-70]EDN98194.1 hypothetical protein SS1G_13051 [Sclerotinia sclerotiorum 1980 UF-70]
MCEVYIKEDNRWIQEQWDIIVVGSGPGGIIGGDLMQRPGWLRGTNLTRVDVPGLYTTIFGDPNADILMCGSDQVNAYGGCTIGGGSAINAGLFFEPPASDWDTYFPEEWNSQNMDAAIQRLYDTQPSTSLTSQDGIRYLQSGYNAARKWLVEGLGYKDVDINDKADDKTGVFGYPNFFYSDGERGGPVTTYLQSSLQRSNFRLQHGVRVVRVERHGDTATGVTALVNGVETFISVTPTGRVILSAGAIISPSLLMHSGIGDLATLSRLNSAGKLSPNLTSDEWIISSEIGTGLFDNPNTFIVLEGDSIQSYKYSYESPPPEDRDLYLNSRSGPYTFASETSVFWTTISHADGTKAGVQGTIGTAGYADYTSDHSITLNVYGTSGLLSTGSVILDDNFIPGSSSSVYYSHPRDAQDISQFIHDIFAALPAAGLTPLNIPQNSTREEIETYITTWSAYARGQVNHWSSSCRLGKCVDVDTKVVGTTNLHVVDASIIAPVTVNPQFAVMAAAEKAAELILKSVGVECKFCAAGGGDGGGEGEGFGSYGEYGNYAGYENYEREDM